MQLMLILQFNHNNNFKKNKNGFTTIYAQSGS